jgi:hypothetical protein
MTNYYNAAIRNIVIDLRAAHYPSDYLLVGLRLGRLEHLALGDGTAPQQRAIDRLQHIAVVLACKANSNLVDAESYRAVAR